jgi:ABC-2 type transport system permease protein
MNKTVAVAWREFTTTVLTKGFIIGVLMTPAIMAITVVAIGLLKNQPGPQVSGVVAVLDESGLVADPLTKRFSPEATRHEAEEAAKEAGEEVDQKLAASPMPLDDQKKAMAKDAMSDQAKHAVASLSNVRLQTLGPEADLAQIKRTVGSAKLRAQSGEADPNQLIALVVIPPAAVRSPEPAKPVFAPYDLFVAPRMDFEIQRRLERRIGAAIVDARITSDPRLSAGGLSPEAIRSIARDPAATAVVVNASGGTQKTIGELSMLLPMGFMLLLMISVFTAGQFLLTTTVEEKSNRVMEILLSAVSPMQLMVGKIFGQMAVGLLILVVYSGVGIAGLFAAALQNLIDPMSLVYTVLFFFIAFFIVASLMAAIGSAVNDMREAQTLMQPVMVILILPWLLWLPISRNPNSTLAQVLSFVPGMNPFVMVIRIAGRDPVPTWQVLGALAVGAATAFAMAWAAAKVFRIGALMYGKPPNLATLVRWIRMA